MRIQTKVPLVVMSACLLVGTASSGLAQSIGANFTGRGADPASTLGPAETAGVVPQASWNNVPGDPFSGTTASLLDSSGNFTGVKLIYEANDSWNSDGPTTTPDERLMKGIHKANPDPDTAPLNNSDRMRFVLTNVPTGGTYNVIVYAAENGANAEMNLTVGATTYYIAEQANFTAAGGVFTPATSTTPGSYGDANYGGFTNVTPAADGTITIIARKNIVDPQLNDGIGVAAIQLVRVSGPAFPANTDTCSITANPQDTFAVAGGTATFTVGTQGPCKIQWTKNNSPISGATDRTLVLTAALADDGAQIRAIVYNNVNTNTSTAATLFVDPVTPPVLTQGFMKVERWENIGGATGPVGIDDLKAAIAAGGPTTTYFVPGANVPQTANPNLSNFGSKVWGWFKPTVSGYYDFFIRSDDPSQLFLNSVNTGTGTNTLPDITTDSPIAQEDGCCNGFQEPGSPRTTATPIFLEAGKLYGAVILYKEGGGGDYVQVAWRLTNDAPTKAAGTLTPIPPVYTWTLASGAGQRFTITTQPTSTTVIEGRQATFSVGVSTIPTAGNYGIQWTKNGTPIPGATGDKYTTPPTTLSDSNAQFQAQIFTLRGQTNSAIATLTVLPDTTPPVPAAASIVGTNVGSTTIQVGVSFDEPVNQADLVAGNFTLIGGSGTIRFPTNSYGDFKSVIFDTTGLIPGNSYTVRVANVRDLKGNAISSAGVDAAFRVRTSVGWANTGSPIRPGQVIPVGERGFDILNGGRQEWASYDEATIAYLVKTNDFDVKVQVIYAEPGSQWTRVGLMARNNLDVGEPADDRNNGASTASAYAQTHVNPNQTIWGANRIDPTGLTPANTGSNNGHEQNQRLTAGGQSSGWGSGVSGAPEYPNEWLRLQRTGTTLHGYRSKDGINWIDQGTTVLTDQQAVMHVGPFAAVETGNIWSTVDHDVWAGPFDPKFDRLFVYQFRNFGNTFGPTLSISRSGSNVTITYTGVLYSAPSLSGPWTAVPGATSPYTTAATGPGTYYRAGEQ